MTRALKDMILQALDKAGGEQYLVEQASKNPVAFMTLLGKVLPLQVSGEGGGPVAFADVEDLDAARETVLAAGATERDAPRQVAPGARICVLADPDGNPIGLRGK